MYWANLIYKQMPFYLFILFIYLSVYFFIIISVEEQGEEK